MAMRRAPTVPDGGWPAGWAAQWLKVLPPAARFVFHGDARARAAAAPIWGPAFCEEACRAAAQATRATLWLGPDEYLLLDSNAASTAGGDLEAALAGVPHALVDVSHRQFALEVSGVHAATLLSAACPLDLDHAEFPVGMCTRTVFAKAGIVLWRTGEDTFHLEAGRSFAGYVGGLLTEIAAEFYPQR
jgi:sarcosine oxidase subunit gamma